MSAAQTLTKKAAVNPQPPPTPLIQVDHLGIDLPSQSGVVEILKDVTFDVYESEFLGIVGRSGTGKTTLLRALAGLTPYSGKLTYEGQPVTKPPATALMVFQDYGNALLPWRTVEKNVCLGLEGHLGKAEQKERAYAALCLVGLEGRMHEYPWRLSGGMQQRVQIARAIAMKPRVLLMDEPFGALDAITKASLQDELLLIQQETNATIVFITHDMDEAVYLSDRVIVIAGAPGTVGTPLSTGIPRPRDQLSTRELPQFLEARHRLGEALREVD